MVPEESREEQTQPAWRWNRPPCPRCGSRRFIPIVYGMGPPDLMADVMRTAKKGLAKVVRRAARPGDPQFACARCGTPLEAGPKW